LAGENYSAAYFNNEDVVKRVLILLRHSNSKIDVSQKVSEMNVLADSTFVSMFPAPCNTFGPAVRKLPYTLRSEIIWLSKKPHMHLFFRFLVTGEMAAS
jgi:hypothetical protein